MPELCQITGCSEPAVGTLKGKPPHGAFRMVLSTQTPRFKVCVKHLTEYRDMGYLDA